MVKYTEASLLVRVLKTTLIVACSPSVTVTVAVGNWTSIAAGFDKGERYEGREYGI